MKLWLDDIRPPPPGYALWAKTADDAIDLLQIHDVTHCSLDHDLADEHVKDAKTRYAIGGSVEEVLEMVDRTGYVEKTGYAVLEWMHEHNRWCPDISVHSMNPRGAADMLAKLRLRAPPFVKYRAVMPPTAPPSERDDSGND